MKMKQQSSGQLAPCISQTASCAMPVLLSLSRSLVFCTVFFPFSCKSFCLFEKTFQDSHVLHPFPLYSCSCCRWFSFTFLQVCSLIESKQNQELWRHLLNLHFFCIFHWSTQVARVFKRFSKVLNSPALKYFLIYKREFIAAAAEKQWGWTAKLTRVLPYRSPMRTWIAWKGWLWLRTWGCHTFCKTTPGTWNTWKRSWKSMSSLMRSSRIS